MLAGDEAQGQHHTRIPHTTATVGTVRQWMEAMVFILFAKNKHMFLLLRCPPPQLN